MSTRPVDPGRRPFDTSTQWSLTNAVVDGVAFDLLRQVYAILTMWDEVSIDRRSEGGRAVIDVVDSALYTSRHVHWPQIPLDSCGRDVVASLQRSVYHMSDQRLKHDVLAPMFTRMTRHYAHGDPRVVIWDALTHIYGRRKNVT